MRQERVVGGVTVFSAEFVKSSVDLKDLPEERLPQVAFLGRSNVGKSSLLNALMGEKALVKVSSSPGKTRELNFFKINDAFYFVDLPGVGYAKVSITKRDAMAESIRNYVEKSEDLKGIIYLVDIRHGGHDIDVETVNSLRETGCPILVVASKKDKVGQAELSKNKKLIQEKFGLVNPPLVVSSVKKIGLDSLWAEILSSVAGTHAK
ncbi:MAG: ribosome biogenesis GTP-binding protein YihA/YsxC [Fibrobacteraceae bacterium]